MEEQQNIEKNVIIRKFSDVYPSGTQFEAEKVEFSDILEKELLIKDIAELVGSFGNFLVILAEHEGREIQFPTGSKVIMPKLIKAKNEEKLPLIATFVSRQSEESKRRYFDIE